MRWLHPGYFLFALSLAAVPPSKAAQQSGPQEAEICLACHGDSTLELTLPSGEIRSLYVEQQAFAASVHGNTLVCTDCHTDMTEVPHSSKPFQTLREFSVAYYEACKRCHFDNYTKLLDSVHYSRMVQGDPQAPLCVDCHDAHATTSPDEPRSEISKTCATCHPDISATYSQSVHGQALLGENNRDVPVCTDCHRSHDIADPRTWDWRLNIPQLCGTCHANPDLMAKYGLSRDVFQTYLADFHGMTASLYRDEKAVPSTVIALCTDCHGIHDISRVQEPGSRVVQANLAKVCQQCHPDASENFPAAWLSHYEPSWQHARLVYLVELFYMIFIPFVIGGLVLQVGLNLWRVVVNR
ncbi:MAG: cytochrome c3 family protein [Acidobacteria bacterium]|nr:cytochrome c3 family protein [Acidobacteriota bacterium]